MEPDVGGQPGTHALGAPFVAEARDPRGSPAHRSVRKEMRRLAEQSRRGWEQR